MTNNRLSTELSDATVEQSKPTIDERFITRIQGKEFVLYSGLLDLAHQRGLIKLDVETLQLPSKDNGNTAICRAVAVSELGEHFCDVGDANPSNVNKKIVPHILRMASTRAKARCLRDFCNIGLVCLEELSDFDDVIASESKSTKRTNGTNGNTNGKATPAPMEKPPSSNNGNGSANMSEAQQRAISNLATRRKMNDEDLEQLVLEQFSTSLSTLTMQQAASLIHTLQQSN